MVKKVNKTRRIEFRVTEDEFNELKLSSSQYKSLSAYVMEACRQHNHQRGIDKFNFINDWLENYSNYKLELARIGSNVNQLAKYTNTMAKSGILSGAHLASQIELQNEIKSQLAEILSFNKKLELSIKQFVNS